MASNYPENSNSSENTNFDDIDYQLAIAMALQRRKGRQGSGTPLHRDSLLEQRNGQLQGNREENRPNFIGFSTEDRLLRHSLALPRPLDPRSEFIVSDTRNEPEYMGDTKIIQTNGQDKSQLATAQISGKVPKVTIPLILQSREGDQMY